MGLSKMDTPACEDLVRDAIEPNPVKPKMRRRKNVKVGVNELSKPPIVEGGLACHTDPQNARRRGYRGNISFVKYFHTSESSSLNRGDSTFFKQMHIGGYGRRVCETANELKESIDQLLPQLDSMIVSLPEFCVSLDPNIVLEPHRDDRMTDYGDDEIVG